MYSSRNSVGSAADVEEMEASATDHNLVGQHLPTNNRESQMYPDRRLSTSNGSNCATAASKQTSMSSIPETIFYSNTTSSTSRSIASNVVETPAMKEKKRPPPPRRNNSENSSVPRMMWSPPAPVGGSREIAAVAAPVMQVTPVNAIPIEFPSDNFRDNPKDFKKGSCCGGNDRWRRSLIILTAALLVVSVSILTFSIVYVAKARTKTAESREPCPSNCYDDSGLARCSCDCYVYNYDQDCSYLGNYYPYYQEPYYNDPHFDDSIYVSGCPDVCHRARLPDAWSPAKCPPECYNQQWQYEERYTQHIEGGATKYHDHASLDDTFLEDRFDDNFDNGVGECPKFCYRKWIHQNWNPVDCNEECYDTTSKYDRRYKKWLAWQYVDDVESLIGGNHTTSASLLSSIDTTVP